MNQRNQWVGVVLVAVVVIAGIYYWSSGHSSSADANALSPNVNRPAVARQDETVLTPPPPAVKDAPTRAPSSTDAKPVLPKPAAENLGTPWIPGGDGKQPFVQIPSDRPPVVDPKSLPAGGLAGTMAPIHGGDSAIQAKHAASTPDQKLARVQEIQTVLGMYDGDPKDAVEFEAYQDLKSEMYWLQQHPK